MIVIHCFLCRHEDPTKMAESLSSCRDVRCPCHIAEWAKCDCRLCFTSRSDRGTAKTLGIIRT